MLQAGFFNSFKGGKEACGNDDDNTVTGSKGDTYTVQDGNIAVGIDGNEYEPYTITLNLERSGIGQNMEETFTAPPVAAIADGDQMADFFFDLGLEDHMAGFARTDYHCSLLLIFFSVNSNRQECLTEDESEKNDTCSAIRRAGIFQVKY